MKLGKRIVTVTEGKRTYFYASGQAYSLDDVTELRVSESGNHYITCKGDKKAIAAAGWEFILLEGLSEWNLAPGIDKGLVKEESE